MDCNARTCDEMPRSVKECNAMQNNATKCKKCMDIKKKRQRHVLKCQKCNEFAGPYKKYREVQVNTCQELQINTN